LRTLKQVLQAILKETGLYYRLKESCLYTLYWTVAGRAVVDDRRREVEFYRTVLAGYRHGDLVFDVGANHGTKTNVFLRLGVRVLAIEPDEMNQRILSERYLRYRFFRRPVTIIGMAVGDGRTVETMWIDEPGSAKNTLSPKWVDILRNDDTRFGQVLPFTRRREVEATTLEELVRIHGLPWYIKIDVEGYELKALKGLERPVPYLSFEVNLPEFRSEGLQCVEQLQRLGANGTFNYVADCREGLVLNEWLAPEEFSRVLADCSEGSIEVFWRTSLASGGRHPR
jgi:FkbM family methyltransferase